MKESLCCRAVSLKLFCCLLTGWLFLGAVAARADLAVVFNGGADVPVVSNGYGASGALSVTLGFAPTPDQVLLVVGNTGSNAVSGTFTGLDEGALISSSFGGNTFALRISYVGGDGNDITLTRVASAGQVTHSNSYVWTHLAGSRGGQGSNDGFGRQAAFNYPNGTAVDNAGNVYVADTANHIIRKITALGVVSTLAGSAGQSGSANGTGGAARFANPAGVAVDGAGNVFVADYYNHTIRKITAAGEVSTLAGSAGETGSANGTGGAARFANPSGVAVDGAGNVFVADSANHTIRKITAAGEVSTLAGSAGLSGSTDGTGDAARFNAPFGVAVDGTGNLFVTDYYNHTLRKITAAGEVSTLAGSAGQSGGSDGTGGAARFYYPFGVAVDGTGNVFVADTFNFTIRAVTAAGVVSTLAGSAGDLGSEDGAGGAARFSYPFGVAVDGAGNLFVADTSNHSIRKVTAAGVVSTLAGSAGEVGSAEGAGDAARFNYPSGVAVDGAGNLFVADTSNHSIRKVTAAGVASTLAGSAEQGGSANGTGSDARFNFPTGVAVDGAGNVFVADRFNQTIRKVTAAGEVSTLAGSAPESGSADGTGSAARFNFPQSVAVDGAGNVFVADFNNHTIRKVTAAGVVSTLAGNAGESGSTDATGSAARFNVPGGVALDSFGNLYVADVNNYTIRKITPAGVVSTLAGSPGQYDSIDGTGANARFKSPFGVAVDAAGTVFVADTDSHAIRRINGSGVVSTIGGLASVPGHAPGFGSDSRFLYPRSVAASADGLLYVVDDNSRVVRGQLAGFQPFVAQGAVSALTGTGATLNGMVNPNGFVTAAQFEYGLTTSYGSTASVTLALPNGTSAQAVSANLSGLLPGTNYFYRLTATNIDGTQSTSGGGFTTLSNNAKLSGLSLDHGLLWPDFDGATPGYTANVANAVGAITARPVAAHSGATIQVRVNGGSYSAVTSGQASAAQALSVGNNTLEVLVTAEDGVTTNTYTVTVTVLTGPVRTLLGSKAGAVPGAGTLPGVPADSTWAGFGVPALNDAGQLAFLGTFNGGGTSHTAIFAGNRATPGVVAFKGAAAPGVDGAVLGTLKDPLLAPDGAVAFVATLANAPGEKKVNAANNTAVYLDADGAGPGAVVLVARTGSEPAGVAKARWAAFTSVALGEDSVALLGTMVTGAFGTAGPGGVSSANNTGLWVFERAGATMRLSLRKGGALLGSKVKVIAALVPPAATAGQGRALVATAQGEFGTVRVSLADGRQALGRFDAAGSAPVFSYVGGQGAAAFDPMNPPQWASFGPPTQNGAAGALAFAGTLKAGTGSATSANNAAIFAEEDAAFALAVLAAKGGAAPGVTGGKFLSFADPVSAADRSVAFAGTLATSTANAISSANNSGLWWRDGAGTLSLLARKGAVATGAAPAAVIPKGVKPLPLWSEFKSLALPEGVTGPLFTGTLINRTGITLPLRPGPGGVTTATDTGLWVLDSTGGLRLLLREGDAIGASTVKSFTVLSAVSGSPAQTRSFNAAGQVVVRVFDVAGGQHLLLIEVP